MSTATERLIRVVRAAHVEAMICGLRQANGRTCGAHSAEAIHDVYPDVAKRDVLAFPLVEADRHVFMGTLGRGDCACCMEDWPCTEARLVREIREP